MVQSHASAHIAQHEAGWQTDGEGGFGVGTPMNAYFRRGTPAVAARPAHADCLTLAVSYTGYAPSYRIVPRRNQSRFIPGRL